MAPTVLPDPKHLIVKELRVQGSGGRSGLSLQIFVQGRDPGKAKGSAPSQPHVKESWVSASRFGAADLASTISWDSVELWKRFWQQCRSLFKPHLTPKPPRCQKDLRLVPAGSYLVWQVLNFRAGGKPEFHIAWVNYKDCSNTWEPVESLPQALHTYCWDSQQAWEACCRYFETQHKPRLPSGQSKARMMFRSEVDQCPGMHLLIIVKDPPTFYHIHAQATINPVTSQHQQEKQQQEKQHKDESCRQPPQQRKRHRDAAAAPPPAPAVQQQAEQDTSKPGEQKHKKAKVVPVNTGNGGNCSDGESIKHGKGAARDSADADAARPSKRRKPIKSGQLTGAEVGGSGPAKGGEAKEQAGTSGSTSGESTAAATLADAMPAKGRASHNTRQEAALQGGQTRTPTTPSKPGATKAGVKQQVEPKATSKAAGVTKAVLVATVTQGPQQSKRPHPLARQRLVQGKEEGNAEPPSMPAKPVASGAAVRSSSPASPNKAVPHVQQQAAQVQPGGSPPSSPKPAPAPVLCPSQALCVEPVPKAPAAQGSVQVELPESPPHWQGDGSDQSTADELQCSGSRSDSEQPQKSLPPPPPGRSGSNDSEDTGIGAAHAGAEVQAVVQDRQDVPGCLQGQPQHQEQPQQEPIILWPPPPAAAVEEPRRRRRRGVPAHLVGSQQQPLLEQGKATHPVQPATSTEGSSQGRLHVPEGRQPQGPGQDATAAAPPSPTPAERVISDGRRPAAPQSPAPGLEQHDVTGISADPPSPAPAQVQAGISATITSPRPSSPCQGSGPGSPLALQAGDQAAGRRYPCRSGRTALQLCDPQKQKRSRSRAGSREEQEGDVGAGGEALNDASHPGEHGSRGAQPAIASNQAAQLEPAPGSPPAAQGQQSGALQLTLPEHYQAEDDCPGSPTNSAEIQQEIQRHAESACAAFRTRFAARFPAMCRKDGIFLYSCRAVLRKGQVHYQEAFDRVQPRIFAQLTQPRAQLYAGVEVFHLTDPCDPCYNNPYVRGDMSESQRGVKAARSFQQGDVVGVYDGRLVTKADHERYAPRDEWDLDTPELAYSMGVEWSKCGDPELELVREGNPQGECPTVFVNHMAYWGPCQKAQDGLPCNCPMYAARKANLVIQHGFQLKGGTLKPLTWMAAARDIAAGEVLLADWDISHLNDMGSAYVRSRLFKLCHTLQDKLLAVKEALQAHGIDAGELGLDLDIPPVVPEQTHSPTRGHAQIEADNNPFASGWQEPVSLPSPGSAALPQNGAGGTADGQQQQQQEPAVWQGYEQQLSELIQQIIKNIQTNWNLSTGAVKARIEGFHELECRLKAWASAELHAAPREECDRLMEESEAQAARLIQLLERDQRRFEALTADPAAGAGQGQDHPGKAAAADGLTAWEPVGNKTSERAQRQCTAHTRRARDMVNGVIRSPSAYNSSRGVLLQHHPAHLDPMARFGVVKGGLAALMSGDHLPEEDTRGEGWEEGEDGGEERLPDRPGAGAHHGEGHDNYSGQGHARGAGRGLGRGRGREAGRAGTSPNTQQAAGSRLVSSVLHHRGRGGVRGKGQGRGRGGSQHPSRSAALATDLVISAVDAARLGATAAHPVHPRIASLKALIAPDAGHNLGAQHHQAAGHSTLLQPGMILAPGHTSMQQLGMMPVPSFPAWETAPCDRLGSHLPLSCLFAPIPPVSRADEGDEEEEVQLLARPANFHPAVDDAHRQGGGLVALHL